MSFLARFLWSLSLLESAIKANYCHEREGTGVFNYLILNGIRNVIIFHSEQQQRYGTNIVSPLDIILIPIRNIDASNIEAKS